MFTSVMRNLQSINGAQIDADSFRNLYSTSKGWNTRIGREQEHLVAILEEENRAGIVFRTTGIHVRFRQRLDSPILCHPLNRLYRCPKDFWSKCLFDRRFGRASVG